MQYKKPVNIKVSWIFSRLVYYKYESEGAKPFYFTELIFLGLQVG